jgi:hypothetical protein
MNLYSIQKIGLIAMLVSSVAIEANAQRDPRGERGGDRPARSEPPSRRSEPRSEPRSAPPQRSQPSESRQRVEPSAPAQRSQEFSPRVERERPLIPNRTDVPSRRPDRVEPVQPNMQPSQPSVVSPRRDENRMFPQRNEEQQRNDRIRPDVRPDTRVRQDNRTQPGRVNPRLGQDSRVRQDNRTQPGRVNPRIDPNLRVNQNPIVNRSHRRNFEAPVQRRINGVSVYERNRMRSNGANTSPRYYDIHRWGRYNLYTYRPYYTYRATFWPFYYSQRPSPWNYDWRWRTSRWYIGWSWYYSPYPYYYSASYWVTDYVISDLLREQYEEGYADGFRDGWDAARDSRYGITEDYKEQIRSQVDQTATAFQNNTVVTLDQVLNDSAYIFAVDTELTVLDQFNNACTLSGGDLLRVNQRPNATDASASMIVVTSKGASCKAGTVVEVSIIDLQEMLNTFNEKVDDGLKQAQDLQQRQN